MQGQLINRDFKFEACTATACAVMGDTLLSAQRGDEVTVTLTLTDPNGTNHRKYACDNPALLQVGNRVPLNEPELAETVKKLVHHQA